MLKKSVTAPYFLCSIRMWQSVAIYEFSELRHKRADCDEEIQSHGSVRFMLVLCSLEVYSEKRSLFNSEVLFRDGYSKILTTHCVVLSFPPSFVPSLALFAVLISLLINLGSPVSEVRRAALNCLCSLRGIKESLLHPVLQHLEQKTEEIISDPTYITQVFLLLRRTLIQVLSAAVSSCLF